MASDWVRPANRLDKRTANSLANRKTFPKPSWASTPSKPTKEERAARRAFLEQERRK